MRQTDIMLLSTGRPTENGDRPALPVRTTAGCAPACPTERCDCMTLRKLAQIQSRPASRFTRRAAILKTYRPAFESLANTAAARRRASAGLPALTWNMRSPRFSTLILKRPSPES